MKPLLKFLSLIAIASLVLSCGTDPVEDSTDEEPEDVGTPAARVIFADNVEQRIGIIDLDKTGEFKTLLDYEHNSLGVPGGIAVNQISKRLYITETDGARIWRINLDSTFYRLVYDSDDGLVTPTAIAIDTVSKKIYWADSGTGQIMTGDLFGSVEPTPLFDGASVVQYCMGITIDHKNNEIYFSDNNSHTIQVGNLDGTGTTTVLYDENNVENIGCPTSIVVSGGNLYWGDNCFNNIRTGKADGTGGTTILFGEEDGVSYPEGIAVDRASKKIYWSETDGYVVARGNLDGSGDRESILESAGPTSISLEFE